MPIKSGPFNGLDRSWKAEDFANYFASFIANGVFPNPSTGLQVYEKENMTVTVKPGKGWINGYFIISDSDYNLTLDTADGVLNRIDRIVMRLDFASREIKIAVKKGTFVSSPVAPTLQRDADAYELALADIYVGKGVTTITQANITDQRLNSTVCGVVRGLITEVDTTTIFNQYQAWFNQKTGETDTIIQNWLVANEQEFNTWFNGIKDILDGDVAANLASRITSLEQELNAHKAEFTMFKDEVNPKLDDLDALVESKSLSVIRSNKDSNGTFKTLTYKRKSDGTVYGTSILSGGTEPQYTTRTETFYDVDGVTVLKTVTYNVTYDAEGDWLEEV